MNLLVLSSSSIVVFMALLFFYSLHLNDSIYGQNITTQSANKPLNISELNLEDLFTQTSNSVVQITVIDPLTGIEKGLGSGFVYDDKGHIITNNHVASITSKSPQIIVTFLNGNTYEAHIIGKDIYSDLAVIKISGDLPSDLVSLPLGNSSDLKVGQTVVAIGNPFGLSGSLTVGVVSGLGRLLPASEGFSNNLQFASPSESRFNIPDVIQTDAAINPGNSGGPLLNLRGEVIGVNSAIFSSTGSYSGIGFAVPSDIVTKVVESIITTGQYTHPYLGITGIDITPNLAEIFGLKKANGFLVTDINEASPASQSDLRKGVISYNQRGEFIDAQGDIIVGIDGNPVRKIDDILTYLEKEKKVDESIILKIFRDGKFLNVEVKLGERPNQHNISQPSGLQKFEKGSNDEPFMSDLYEDCLKMMPKNLCDLL